MEDDEVRRAIQQHSAAAGQDEHEASKIDAEDAVIEFPQGGRIRGKANIEAFRSVHPAELTFEARRTVGAGDLRVNEYLLRYDGRPSHVVGIVEFRDGLVVRETIYFGKPWEPPAWHAQWVEPLDS